MFCYTFSHACSTISPVLLPAGNVQGIHLIEPGFHARGKGPVMASEYDVHRQGWRLECGDTCLLRHNGRSAECILVDISVSGVLVSCDDELAENLLPGDSCALYLNGDPSLYPGEVVCRVTRRDASRIGLQFPSGV